VKEKPNNACSLLLFGKLIVTVTTKAKMAQRIPDGCRRFENGTRTNAMNMGSCISSDGVWFVNKCFLSFIS